MGCDLPVPGCNLRLHVAPVALDVLGVGLAPHESDRVVDPVVAEPVPPHPVVTAVLVRDDHAAPGHVLADHRAQGAALHVRDDERADVPIALAQADHGRFARGAPAPLPLPAAPK